MVDITDHHQLANSEINPDSGSANPIHALSCPAPRWP